MSVARVRVSGSGIDRFGTDQRREVVRVGLNGGHARRCAGRDEGVVVGDIGRERVPARRADEDQPELLPGAEVRRLQRPVGRHHFGLGLRGRGQQGQAGPRAGAVRSLPGLATARRALGRAPAPATMTPGSEEQSILRAVMTGKRRWQPAPSLAPTRPAAVVRRRVRPRRPGPGRRLQQGLDAFLTKPQDRRACFS